MNMIEHMAGTPTYKFSFYEMLLLSLMIAGCIIFSVMIIAFCVLGFVFSPWYFLASAASLTVFCFCLSVVLFTTDK